MYEYKIRPAQITDARILAKIGIDNFSGYPFRSIFDPAILARGIMAMNMAIGAIIPDYRIVIEDESGTVGTAVLGSPDDGMGEIKRVLVDQRGRNNGYAREMTIHLTNLARSKGLQPYADVRADQRGMQRAAFAAGLHPYSLEQAKHVVYSHIQDGDELGAARETMIHMNSLQPDEQILHNQLKSWPRTTVERLIINMQKAFSPPIKDHNVSKDLLPSADSVREKIEKGIIKIEATRLVQPLNKDMVIVTDGNIQLLIIKPDASGFLLTPPDESLPQFLAFAEEVGLQVVTYYGNLTYSNISLLVNSGMEPTMVRPWKIKRQPSEWQIGWKKAMNKFDLCQHTLDLDPTIQIKIERFIASLAANV